MSHCVVTLDFFGCFCFSQHVASKVQKYMSDFVQILIKKKINEIRSKPLQELQNATTPFKFQSKDLRAVCQNEILSATRSCLYQIGAKIQLHYIGKLKKVI